MSKELTPLQAWERANNNTYEHGYEISGDLCYIIETALKRLEELEKSLKALEIIKKKKVYLPFIEQFDLKFYNEHCAYMSLYEYYLTEEEYNLLKEVLM